MCVSDKPLLVTVFAFRVMQPLLEWIRNQHVRMRTVNVNAS